MNRSTKQNYVRCRVCVLTLTFALGCMENLGSTPDNSKHETHGWVNLAPSPLPHAVIGGALAHNVLRCRFGIRGDQGHPWGSR